MLDLFPSTKREIQRRIGRSCFSCVILNPTFLDLGGIVLVGSAYGFWAAAHVDFQDVCMSSLYIMPFIIKRDGQMVEPSKGSSSLVHKPFGHVDRSPIEALRSAPIFWGY